jgi:CDP-diacylglycerol--glycerol-3-phosphate 3-phosphatidyltransferase
VLDSLVDRVADGSYLCALRALGAPASLCVLGGVATGMHEYLRARAGNAPAAGSAAGSAGAAELVVVTVAERPTRVIVTAFALAGAGLLPRRAGAAATLGAAAWLGLGMVGFAQLARAVHGQLAG